MIDLDELINQLTAIRAANAVGPILVARMNYGCGCSEDEEQIIHEVTYDRGVVTIS